MLDQQHNHILINICYYLFAHDIMRLCLTNKSLFAKLRNNTLIWQRFASKNLNDYKTNQLSVVKSMFADSVKLLKCGKLMIDDYIIKFDYVINDILPVDEYVILLTDMNILYSYSLQKYTLDLLPDCVQKLNIKKIAGFEKHLLISTHDQGVISLNMFWQTKSEYPNMTDFNIIDNVCKLLCNQCKNWHNL